MEPEAPPPRRLLTRDTLVHVLVRCGGASVLGVLTLFAARATTGFPFTTPVLTVFLGAFGGALSIASVLVERWQHGRPPSARRDALLGLATSALTLLLFAPLILQAYYGAGVMEYGALDAGTTRASTAFKDMLRDPVYTCFALSCAGPQGWVLWLSLRAPRGAVVPAALGAALLAWLPLLFVDLQPEVRMTLPALLAAQALGFFPLRWAARRWESR